MEIVGVVANARVRSLRGNIDPKFYAPADETGGASWFEIRTTVDPVRILPAVRKTILAIDGDLLEFVWRLARIDAWSPA